MNERDALIVTRSSSVIRVIAIALIVSGLLLGVCFLDPVLETAGRFDTLVVRTLILAAQGGALLLGLGLLVAKQGGWSLLTKVALLLLSMMAFAAYATPMWRGWIHLPVRDLPELRVWLEEPGNYLDGEGLLMELEAELSRLDPEGSKPVATLDLTRRLADQYLNHGRIAEAIEELEKALESAQAMKGIEGELVYGLHRGLAVAHLRRGEVSHCLENSNNMRCLFPIQGRGVWSDIVPAQAAIPHLDAALEIKPRDPAARWLLIIAHMVAGTYPDGLDEADRLPTSSFESEQNIPLFRDVAGIAGVDTVDLGRGSIMDDFDGDGLVDIVTSSRHSFEPMRYLHNNGAAGWPCRSRLSRRPAPCR